MTRKKLFEIAERDYPIGTVYKCARDGQQVTREDVLHSHQEGENLSVYTMIKDDSHYQFIYDGPKNRWAKIVTPAPNQVVNEYSIY
jgi:hypothetical protein